MASNHVSPGDSLYAATKSAASDSLHNSRITMPLGWITTRLKPSVLTTAVPSWFTWRTSTIRTPYTFSNRHNTFRQKRHSGKHSARVAHDWPVVSQLLVLLRMV